MDPGPPEIFNEGTVGEARHHSSARQRTMQHVVKLILVIGLTHMVVSHRHAPANSSVVVPLFYMFSLLKDTQECCLSGCLGSRPCVRCPSLSWGLGFAERENEAFEDHQWSSHTPCCRTKVPVYLFVVFRSQGQWRLGWGLVAPAAAALFARTSLLTTKLLG